MTETLTLAPGTDLETHYEVRTSRSGTGEIAYCDIYDPAGNLVASSSDWTRSGARRDAIAQLTGQDTGAF